MLATQWKVIVFRQVGDEIGVATPRSAHESFDPGLGNYSLSPGFWQSFFSIEVCRDCIPALASSCKKQLTGFFVCLLFFLKVKRIS